VNANGDPLLTQRLVQPLDMLAISATQKLRFRKIGQLNAVSRGEFMIGVENQLKRLTEKRPSVQPVPIVVEFRSERKLDVALF
jgi:hypothetical protein